MQLAVHVTPKAGRDEVLGWREGTSGERELALRVASAPEKGKATKAAAGVLAAFFDIPKSSVKCVRGETSRHKMFELPDSVDLSII
jgi:uncharacterized protein YggU (UPF0235/DUF167 family)